jgi:hypothetical protein
MSERKVQLILDTYYPTEEEANHNGVIGSAHVGEVLDLLLKELGVDLEFDREGQFDLVDRKGES